LYDIEQQLDGHLFGAPTLADFAILPFVRQFAFIDKDWFDAQDWPKTRAWLERFLASEAFAAIMPKVPQWHSGEAGVRFPFAA
jgi:glutathione S-transferase